MSGSRHYGSLIERPYLESRRTSRHYGDEEFKENITALWYRGVSEGVLNGAPIYTDSERPGTGFQSEPEVIVSLISEPETK